MLRNLRSGFTLMELSVSLVVMGAIMTLVYSNIDFSILEKVRRLQVETDRQKLTPMWAWYENEHGPIGQGTKLVDLDGKFPLSVESLRDPWGTSYFICLDFDFKKQICSLGADRETGGMGMDMDFYLTDKKSWPPWLRG